jgi:beta-mannosidase
MLRKTQCAGGWDWNICLMPLGLYGEANLRRHGGAIIEHVEVRQRHHAGGVALAVISEVHAYAAGRAQLLVDFDGQVERRELPLSAGLSRHEIGFDIAAPRLWWPNGQGEQHLYPLNVQLDGQVERRRIGLRTIELVTEPDAIGTTMKFRVNGRDLFAKGANWIPADALPGRITPESVRPLLQSAAQANMNMLRVWGGGNYEKEFFYDACDELGLLVWQDFMFSCMHYPSDRAFLKEVRLEARHQVQRLQHRACVALWCGDNEIVGALTWYPATQANRDRYLVNYDRLNRVLEEVVEDSDPTRRFWASSPSLGQLDYADGWHCDTRGDMHFWEVWHSAKPFEHYRSVKPRFCSEFGFQSFPSYDCIAGFTEAADRNVSSAVMEVHQRNGGGNARILETMTRNFRFPRDFAQMVYLSQIQQALAMKTAIDAWRSLKPRCMGTLYWQLNDTWPVASWSSMEYGGRWKVLQYLARRFYAGVSVISARQDDGTITLAAVSDVPRPLALQVRAVAIDMAGRERLLWEGGAQIDGSAAVPLAALAGGELGAQEFMQVRWQDADGTNAGEDDYLPRYYKEYELPRSEPRLRWLNGHEVIVEADAPCFFTWLDTAVPGRFSDNAFTLLPGHPRQLRWTGDALAPGQVTVRHLAHTY